MTIIFSVNAISEQTVMSFYHFYYTKIEIYNTNNAPAVWSTCTKHTRTIENILLYTDPDPDRTSPYQQLLSLAVNNRHYHSKSKNIGNEYILIPGRALPRGEGVSPPKYKIHINKNFQKLSIRKCKIIADIALYVWLRYKGMSTDALVSPGTNHMEEPFSTAPSNLWTRFPRTAI